MANDYGWWWLIMSMDNGCGNVSGGGRNRGSGCGRRGGLGGSGGKRCQLLMNGSR